MSRPRGRGGNGRTGRGPGRGLNSRIFGGTTPPGGMKPATKSGGFCSVIVYAPALVLALLAVWGTR